MTVQKPLQTNEYKVVRLLEMPNGGSDEVLKKDISEVNNVLERVLALHPVVIHNEKHRPETSRVRYGFNAKEVEKLFPELIVNQGGEEGSVSPNDLLPYIVAALKEQNAQVAELKGQLSKVK